MGILSTLAAPVSGVVGSVASIINTNKTNKANKQLAEYQYSKDLEMWNRQNAYNDPSAQMARYQGAGLNPNLIYGTGTASAGNATSMPHYQAPSMQYHYEAPNIMPTMGAFVDLKAKNAQIQSINEDITSKRLNNQILTATLLDQISGKKWTLRNAQNVYDYTANKAAVTQAEAENADKFYGGRGEASMQQGKFMRQMLEQQLKNSMMANTLQGKTLEKYNADIAGANLNNEAKKMQNKWYGTAGIHSATDLVPFIKMIFSK
ncbi:MAG: DNA pilot protein [Microviridae sp.]|nr:MAG: DNA pilot protein [Microviridae sp.]